MFPPMNQIRKNNVVNRFLPIPESVLKGLEPEPKITDFTLIREIGTGSFGRVLLVQHKVTQAQYAIKAIDKRNQANQKESIYFRREIEIMYRIHHPNVVKLFGHFEDNTYCYFIMEYIEGGNIYSYVPKNGIKRISTQQIASIIKDVISATYFLHHMNPPIIHRDIKPENVLLNSSMQAKLTDFGWSNYMNYGYKRTTVCGTPIYLAPEIINNTGHDEKVDIWCIGVLLFELITGVQPFSGFDIQTVKYNISRLKINWPRNIDKTAADLISKILKYNPEERISLRNMLNHPFFTQFFPNPTNCLIKPDNTQYKVYIINKDHPFLWNPVYTGSYININPTPTPTPTPAPSPAPKQNYEKEYSSINLGEYNYDNLYQKYDTLKNEMNRFKSEEYTTNDLINLRNELKEKDKKINKIERRNTNQGFGDNWYTDYKEQFKWENTYNDLKNENYELKNKLNLYENYFKTETNPIFLDNDFNNIRNSITQNNKVEFSNAITQLSSNLDGYIQDNFNTIIMMKDKEIEKLQQQNNLRREAEKQQFSNLISKYDQTLTYEEKENQKLKMRLKELEGFFV